jgi:hypothetical protein
MRSDDTLFAWIRYYGGCILLFGVVGFLAALLSVFISPDHVAASTLVVQSGDSIKPRQLGPLAVTVFRSESVMASASRELGEPDLSVVEKGTDLIPLPDSPALIVLGRAGGYEEAYRLSGAAAGAMVEALNQQVDPDEFRIFGGPQGSYVPGEGSLSVSAAIGAATGFWLGLACAVLHYRWKRPVLTLRRALVLSGADQLAIHRGRGWPWLGFLRDRFQRRELARNEIRLAWLRMSSEELSSASTDGARRDARVDEGRPATPPNEADVLVITVRPGTEERAVASSRLMVEGADADRAGRIGLVWVR